MTLTEHPSFLRSVLLLDAASGFITGLLMAAAAGPLAAASGLPAGLLQTAGLALLPIAAFMAFVAWRQPIWRAGVWLIIAGNLAWVVGSLMLLAGPVTPNGLGSALVLGQALAVLALAAAEYLGVRQAALAA